MKLSYYLHPSNTPTRSVTCATRNFTIPFPQDVLRITNKTDHKNIFVTLKPDLFGEF